MVLQVRLRSPQTKLFRASLLTVTAHKNPLGTACVSERKKSRLKKENSISSILVLEQPLDSLQDIGK